MKFSSRLCLRLNGFVILLKKPIPLIYFILFIFLVEFFFPFLQRIDAILCRRKKINQNEEPTFLSSFSRKNIPEFLSVELGEARFSTGSGKGHTSDVVDQNVLDP